HERTPMNPRTLAFFALTLLACDGEAEDPACQLVEDGFGSEGTTAITATVIASGLEVPWSIAFLPEGDMLVTEREGRVRVVKMDGTVGPSIIMPAVTSTAESGLLGLALHPQFAQNGFFYIYFTSTTDAGDRNQVERWILSPDRLVASFDRIIVSDIAAGQFHDGGRIRFGPDGMLYIGTGDGREPDRSQDVDDLAGKILRVDPDGGIPADNPFPGKAAYILGVRNTQGFDWRDDGTMVVTDHGPSGEYQNREGHDELNVVEAGDNLGWPTIYACESRSGMVSPSMTWKTALPPGGASFFRGDAISGWNGSLLISSLRGEHLQRVVFDPDDGRGTCGPENDLILRIGP
ncbi:MAG: PQQ-dependent sugar dehydrogenase, partial [Polyangiaceae bacterium]|nr:PQQ-dependent sugar dehydrogenase [Polyangiaceae bacterium]